MKKRNLMFFFFKSRFRFKTEKRKRQAAYQLGHYAEWFASLALRAKGFRILERRWKTRLGEIDLIAKRGNLLVIVEVKARRSLCEAMEAVTRQSECRIERAANIWLSKRSDISTLSIRFDMIAVLPWRWPVHIENFFQGMQ